MMIGILITAFVSFKLIIALILFALAIAFLILYKKLGFFGILTLACALSIIFSSFFYKQYESPYENTSVTGKIASVSLTDYGYIIYLDSCDIGATDEVEDIGICAYYYGEDFPLVIKEGYLIKCVGNAEPVILQKHANPGEANPRLSLMVDGIFYYLYIDEITVENAEPDLNYYFNQLKQRVRQVIFKNVDNSDSAAVSYAMLTGDRSYITDEISSVFSRCGTSHLLAVSGLHISILISLITFCLKRLRASNAVSLVTVTIFVVIYALFTGLSPSVLRASVMACTLAFAGTFSNRYDSVNALGLAGIFILLLNPFILFEIAFQLSFCACLGIMVFTRHQINSKYKILNFIVNSGLITLGATLFTLPLQIYYFGEASLVSIFANMLLVPLASFSLMLCFLFVLLSFLWQGFGFFIKFAGYLLEGVIIVSKFFAKAPVVRFQPVSSVLIVFIIGLLIFFTRFIRVHKKKFIASILLIVFTVCSVLFSIYKNNTVKISVPYINDYTLCAHIEGKDTYIIGLSNNSNYLLRNARKIDHLFLITDDDMDNLEYLDGNIIVKNIYVAPGIAISKKARMLNAKHIEGTVSLKDGKFFFLNNGVVFENGVNSVFIGSGARNKIYTVAITIDPLVRAKTVITNGTEHTFNQKLYDIKFNGYTTLTLRSYNEPY